LDAAGRVADSCGYGVPLMRFTGKRTQYDAWVEKKVRAGGLDEYVAKKNAASIDGLPAIYERPAARARATWRLPERAARLRPVAELGPAPCRPVEQAADDRATAGPACGSPVPSVQAMHLARHVPWVAWRSGPSSSTSTG
jgi:hypothetical protein